MNTKLLLTTNMRNVVLVVLCILGITSINAQEKGEFRLGFDVGYALFSGGESILSNLEVKYNLTDKSNIGLRFGRVARSSLKNNDISEKEWTNYSASYDYYFHKEGSSLASFLGAGLGIYKIRSFQEVTKSGFIFFVPFEFTTLEEVSNKSKFGFIIRGGLELGKFRLALEYNLVPKIDFEGGEIKNSYLGISLGFYVGGGKWKLN